MPRITFCYDSVFGFVGSLPIADERQAIVNQPNLTKVNEHKDLNTGGVIGKLFFAQLKPLRL